MFDPALNAALQRLHSPALDLFFQIATALAYAPVLIALLAMLYWGWDKSKAFGLVLVFIYGCLIENLLKETFQTPRPFQVDPAHVRLLDYFMRLEIAGSGIEWAIPARTSFSFPSGHAMMSVVFYGALALHWRRRWATIGALAAIAMIGLSRLYLGCHFLGDVLGGYAAGGAVLVLYAAILWLEDRRLGSPSDELLVFLLLAAPVGLFLYTPDSASAGRLAYLLGFSAGYFAERRWIGFSPAGADAPRIARFTLGVAVMAGLYFLFGAAFDYVGSEANCIAYPVVRSAVRYGAIGLAASWALPALFVRVGLADRLPPARTG